MSDAVGRCRTLSFLVDCQRFCTSPLMCAYATACTRSRNPNLANTDAAQSQRAHSTGDWDEQVALEYLAALSALARWINEASVMTA